MHIGLVCPYRLSTPGGVQEHIKALAQQLGHYGHRVTIISPGQGKRLQRGHIFIGRSIKVPTQNRSWAYLSLFLDSPPGQLKKLLREQKFDLLHFHEPFSPFLCWQILQNSSVFNVATFHSEWRSSGHPWVVNSLGFLLRPLTPRIREKLHGVIAVSQAAAQSWPEIFDSSRPQAIIPNGIDLQRFHPQVPPRRIFGNLPTILFVGRIEARKGLGYLLRAFNLLIKRQPQVRLVIVGSGPLAVTARLWVKKQQLEEAVFFAGRVSDAELPSFYRGADLFCSPATGGESFGIVLLEAMASGLPLVVFANQGYRETLKNCPFPDAVLIPNRDFRALSQALERVLFDSQLKEKIQRWGLKEVQQYSWQRIGRKINSFYEKVLYPPLLQQ